MAVKLNKGVSYSNINVTPMIDYLLFLLIFFLVTTTFEETEREMSVVLPEASEAMPLTALDRAIGFAPWSLILYGSLWFYISLVPSLFHAWQEMRVYLVQVTLLSFVGFAIFLFWPTAVPPADIDWSAHPSVAFLKSVDATGNACPSLHVAFAVLTAVLASICVA